MTTRNSPRDDRWYLAIMSPNTKGDKFAWLDPTSIYINGEAFHDLLDDLVADLDGITVDVVAGLDAMGFVLASALATRLGVGFLPVRKAGKLCVATDKVSFSNYSGRTQDMEMRQPAFAPGTKVLVVDQWWRPVGPWVPPSTWCAAKAASWPDWRRLPSKKTWSPTPTAASSAASAAWSKVRAGRPNATASA